MGRRGPDQPGPGRGRLGASLEPRERRAGLPRAFAPALSARACPSRSPRRGSRCATPRRAESCAGRRPRRTRRRAADPRRRNARPPRRPRRPAARRAGASSVSPSGRKDRCRTDIGAGGAASRAPGLEVEEPQAARARPPPRGSRRVEPPRAAAPGRRSAPHPRRVATAPAGASRPRSRPPPPPGV